MLTSSSTLVTVNTDPLSQAASNEKRRSLLIQSKGGGTISVKFGQSITVNAATGINDGIDIAPGGYLLWDRWCPIDQIFMVANTANSLALIVEILEND